MFDVYFSYTDSKLNMQCTDVTSIEQCDTQWCSYSGEELMKHRFNISKTFHLFAEDKRYIISAKDLIGVEITKK